MADTNGLVILTDRFRTGKAYTAWQAAGLAGVSNQTARRWLLGSDESDRRGDPVFGQKDQDPDQPVLMLSFLELIELTVVARFRRHAKSLKLENIREAHRYAREKWDLPYPFASANLLALGGHLLSDFAQSRQTELSEWVALDLHGAPSLPGLVRMELEQNVEYDNRFAGKWWPRGRSIPIVIDPHIAAGRPTIADSGVTVATLRARRRSGELMTTLARDYDLPIDTIDQVLQVADIAA